MPGTIRLACGAPRDSTRREVLAQRSVRRWLLVRTLGGELCLRNQRRAACSRNSFANRKRVLPARGEVAARGAKSRRQFWRILVELHRSDYQGARKQHGIANSLGPDRTARR